MISAALAPSSGQQTEAAFSRRRAGETLHQPIARNANRLPGEEHGCLGPVAVKDRKAVLARSAIVIGKHLATNRKNRCEQMIKGGGLA